MPILLYRKNGVSKTGILLAKCAIFYGHFAYFQFVGRLYRFLVAARSAYN